MNFVDEEYIDAMEMRSWLFRMDTDVNTRTTRTGKDLGDAFDAKDTEAFSRNSFEPPIICR